MSQALLRFVGCAALVCFLVAAFTPAVNVLSYWLAPARRTEPAEAIVVLGSGGVAASGVLTDSSMHAAMDGVVLYQKGLAPLVVFSGAPEGSPKGEAEARADLARSCGVPDSAILTSTRARTTHEEGREIHALLASRHIGKILLIADSPGMGRAMKVFERVGFDVVPAPWTEVLDLGGTPEDRLGQLRQVAMELVALVYYRAAGYL